MTSRLPKKIDFDVIEQFLSSLGSQNAEEHPQLPLGFKNRKVGVTSCLIQALITYCRSTKNPVIECKYLDVTSNEKVVSFTNDAACLTALLMSDDLITVVPGQGKQSLNSFLVHRFDELTGHEVGHQYQYLTVDHSIQKFHYPPFFYEVKTNGERRVKSSGAFAAMVRKYLATRVKIRRVANEEYADIGKLLQELISNTDEHAQTDVDGNPYKRSVRGMLFDYHLINRDQQNSYLSDTESFISSFISATAARPKFAPIHFFEMSVFDSGPGLYARKSQHLLSEETASHSELEIVNNCFKENETSKPYSDGFGKGLYRAMKLLNARKGLIIVRTGRLFLYRDFKRQPMDSENDVELVDAITGASNAVSSFNLVAGVSYTVIVPIKSNE